MGSLEQLTTNQLQTKFYLLCALTAFNTRWSQLRKLVVQSPLVCSYLLPKAANEAGVSATLQARLACLCAYTEIVHGQILVALGRIIRHKALPFTYILIIQSNKVTSNAQYYSTLATYFLTI